MITAGLLTDQNVTLRDVPQLTDIHTLIKVLEELGAVTDGSFVDESGGSILNIHAHNITDFCAPYELVRQMRASILVLGPLLARFGEAKVSLPGGCAIGARPVDMHLHAMRGLGADIILEDGYIEARAPKGLKGSVITFPKVSVGATENAIMAACLADGETILQNVAQEPEIDDLINMLNKMGALIEKSSPQTLKIQGKPSLSGVDYTVMPDRIEMGTYAIAAAMTDGDIILEGGGIDPTSYTGQMLIRSGVQLEKVEKGVRASKGQRTNEALEIITQPYPGFPTDLQAQTMALLSITEGVSQIKETIFENRFMHVPELSRMGANITLNGSIADIVGIEKLKAAEVMATDLRASVSLILAALAAEGDSQIHRIYHLDRGYEKIEEKLLACGAEIERCKE